MSNEKLIPNIQGPTDVELAQAAALEQAIHVDPRDEIAAAAFESASEGERLAILELISARQYRLPID